MNETIKRIASQASKNVRNEHPELAKCMTIADYGKLNIRLMLVTEYDVEEFAKLLIQEYEKEKREERRNVKSKLGYSRIGLKNI